MREFYRILTSLLMLLLSFILSIGFPCAGTSKQNSALEKFNDFSRHSSSLIKANFSIKDGSDVAGVIRRSLKTWENAAAIEFEEISSDKQTVSPTGNFGDGVSLITIAQTSENLSLFSGNTEEVAARTRVFFNKKAQSPKPTSYSIRISSSRLTEALARSIWNQF
jgi:hypothetical protein